MAHSTQNTHTEPRNPRRPWAVKALVAMVIGVFVFMVVPLVAGGMLSLNYAEFWKFFGGLAWALILETWQGKVTAGVLLMVVGALILAHFRDRSDDNTDD